MTTAALQLVVRRTPVPGFAPGGARIHFTMPSDVYCI